MENVLKLYTYIDGVNDTPFPNVENQVLISSFRYESKRMGATPTLSCTIMHKLCLDKLWSDNVYAVFNGERYFIKQIPSSSYSNNDSRYKHEVTFVSERVILDNVYMYDVVSENTENDKPISNSSKFSFYGTINEFANRLNHSLLYSGVGYSVVVDDGITSEGKLLSFEDSFFSEALQEVFNVFEVPYYFVGRVIHIGYTNNAITKTFKYGADESLLSIQKTNANFKITNRVTGIGSEDNIPYYYPNRSEKGESKALYNGSSDNIQIVDTKKYDKLYLSDKFKYEYISPVTSVPFGKYDYRSLDYNLRGFNQKQIILTYFITLYEDQVLTFYQYLRGQETWNSADIYGVDNDFHEYISGRYQKTLKAGQYKIVIDDIAVIYLEDTSDDKWVSKVLDDYFSIEVSLTTLEKYGWSLNGNPVYLNDYGLSALISPQVGDVITFERTSYIAPQKYLMPPIYRESFGKERFYNALNNEYQDGNGGYYEFENPYRDGQPKEQIVSFEHIKPSIVGATNANGERIDMFVEFAYDANDNDETKIIDGKEQYSHPYFFAKLRKFNGQFGFNLFDQAIDEGEMTISMTSGSCGACNFAIRVNDNNKNTVQVDDFGRLMRDEDGNVLFGEPQDKQNDTINNEVWVALQKDIDTFGVVMPNASNNYKPSSNDTFVILHIDLPYAYIEQAEDKLKDEIIKYMSLNNSEKFNFSISFSSIFFAENPDILEQLNENARIQIEYNAERYELYVSSFSYSMSNDKPLPEIKVELSDTLTITQNAIQTAISEVKDDILSNIGNSQDFLKQGLRYFLRKDTNDRSKGKISSDNGFEAGRFVSGFLGGTGAWIGADGHGEMGSLTLREFLEAPEYRCNRVDVVSGELWNSIAFGMVEEVDIEKRICKVKLEENERCGLHVGDFCRGIFADFSGGNNWEDEDECRFMHLYGFCTSYFTPTEILDNEVGLFRFKYELKPDTTQHPIKSMKFAVYGNPKDTSRQASAYATRTYKRYLNGVDTWVIEPDRHIYAQYGDLNGLQIDGVNMKGYGSFQSNAYFRGVQIQLPPEQMESLKGDSAYSAQLTSYVGTVKLDANGNMSGGMFEELNVIANGLNVVCRDFEHPEEFRNVTTKNYRLTTTVQAYKGTTPLYYSANVAAKGSFTLALACVGCTASVVNGAIIINSITDTKNCRINITVNCEGMAVYNLEYNVVFVQDGGNGQPGNPGKDAVSYRIQPNITTISKTMTGSLEPESVKFMLQANKGGVIYYYPTLWSLKGRNIANGDWTTLKTANSETGFDVVFTSDYKYYELSAKTYGDGDVMLGDTLNISIVADGKNGDSIKGDKGVMPRYRGEFVFYNESDPYVYNDDYRDIVIYEGNVFQVYKYGDSVTEPPTVPTNSDNDGRWQIANKMRFVAMDTALIDNANIAGFTFARKKYINGAPVGVMRSQYGPICVHSVASNVAYGSEISVTINDTITKYIKIKKFKNTAYSLVPSVKKVVRRKNNNGEWVYDVNFVSCNIKKITESGTTIVSYVEGYNLRYSIDSGTEVNGNTTTTSGASESIKYVLYDTNGVEVARHTILVLSDGDDTVKAVFDNESVPLLVNTNGEVLSGLPHRLMVTLWQGANEISITEFSISSEHGVEVVNEIVEIDTETGTLKCTNAVVTGEVNATSGNIGGFALSGNQFLSDFEHIGLRKVVSISPEGVNMDTYTDSVMRSEVEIGTYTGAAVRSTAYGDIAAINAVNNNADGYAFKANGKSAFFGDLIPMEGINFTNGIVTNGSTISSSISFASSSSIYLPNSNEPFGTDGQVLIVVNYGSTGTLSVSAKTTNAIYSQRYPSGIGAVSLAAGEMGLFVKRGTSEWCFGRFSS